MSDAEALRLVSPTVTMGQVASASINDLKQPTNKTTIDNIDFDKTVGNQNKIKIDGTSEYATNELLNKNRYNAGCVTHPDYIRAMQAVKQQNKFKYNNREYTRIGNNIYLNQYSIPAVARELSQDETEKFEHEIAIQQWDPALNSNVNGPGDAVAGALATALLLGLKNATALAIIGKSATSFVTDSVSGLGKNYLKEQIK